MFEVRFYGRYFVYLLFTFFDVIAIKIPFLPENELPQSGTFGRDGQKVDESSSDAKASTTSSASPVAKKQCNSSSSSSSSSSSGDGSAMTEADKVCK